MDSKAIERIELKLDKLDNRIDRVDIELAKYNIQLAEHMRRTALLEKEHEMLKETQQQQKGAVKLLSILGIIGTLCTIGIQIYKS
jgi:chromosome segregation ATPase